jgi:hypothetical protein
MKRNDALPGKYLAKEDFETPTQVQIMGVEMEDVEGDHGTERKPVLYINGNNRGMILNGTNWDKIVELTNEPDSDNWKDLAIEIYHDPDVMFGRKKVGGIRVRQSADGTAAFN